MAAQNLDPGGLLYFTVIAVNEINKLEPEDPEELRWPAELFWVNLDQG
ncbi:MAG: hypothetical protein K0R50_254 [Eubacterium sp.]|jgi:hypothetical protein|nr:hypothetical protein [Eubacterium sp.]